MNINPVIVGTGSYAPEHVLTNFHLSQIVDTNDEWIRQRTGIARRHVATDDQAASDLGLEAAQNALDDASMKPEDVDIIVVATNTGDMLYPSTSCVLQDKLGIGGGGTYDVASGCSGFIYALSTAKGHIYAGDAETILVVATEVTSAFNNWEDRSTCVLFGDGAGAVVLQNKPDAEVDGLNSINIHSDGQYGDILQRPAGGSAMPITKDILDEGLHYTKMDGPALFKIAVRSMGESALEALDDAGLTADEIDLVIPHQANNRIIESVKERLEISQEKLFVNIEEYGNTSAASVPLALDEAYRQGRIGSGDKVLMVAFGAGLSWGATVVTYP